MSLFRRNPLPKLKKAYEQKLSAAMQAMRDGDVRKNAMLTAEADELKKQIDELEQPDQ